MLYLLHRNNKLKIKTMGTYSRIWCGHKLTANIISINESKVIYTLNDGKTIHKEYAPLFHSSFKKD